MAEESTDRFLHYEEPDIIAILVLVSFFYFLGLSGWVSRRVLQAHILGPIVVGIIYGKPLANILHQNWQETFLALGYIGLILIIFEGGLTTRLDLLQSSWMLATFTALIGVLLPIGFSYLLLYMGFGYGAVETFIIGAALSTTSLGTTFAVISSAAKRVDLSTTWVGAILVSAAVIDDVSGLVMASVIDDLGHLGPDSNLGWIIGRPILASGLMAILTYVLTKWVFAPLFRRYIEHHFAQYDHLSNIALMIFVLSAFISIAAYAGTSVLFGAFLAGTFLTYLPSKHPEGPFCVLSREEGETRPEKSPTFVHSFERYLSDVQSYLLEPLFFGSIGFAIPFLKLWTGTAIWKGITYSLLMLAGKFLAGLPVPLTEMTTFLRLRRSNKKSEDKEAPTESLSLMQSLKVGAPSAALLGAAMVARGEIGLLIIQIGYNNTDYVSEGGFITGVWAILLNTIIGPIVVGLLVKYKGEQIARSDWGTVSDSGSETAAESGEV